MRFPELPDDDREFDNGVKPPLVPEDAWQGMQDILCRIEMDRVRERKYQVSVIRKIQLLSLTEE